MDYRLSEHRRTAFINWFKWGLELEDCDSALYLTNYFFERFEYNIEQRLWLCWLYGTTYNFPTAYLIWNEFPDMELVGVDRLREWNNENYSRLRYQTDTKWNKGHLADQFESYKAWVGDRSQAQAFAELCNGDKYENFDNVWEAVNSLHKFGRYTSWFYIQTLKQCADLNVDVPNLWLHDYSGSKSHRNGLCYALGKDDWVSTKLTADQIQWMEDEGASILREVKLSHPNLAHKADFFAMETALCSFKKLFRKSRGRYLGYYIDRQAEEIKKVECDEWVGIDWTPMWDARKETLRNEYLTNSVNKGKMELFLDTGKIDHMNTFTNEMTDIGLERFMI